MKLKKTIFILLILFTIFNLTTIIMATDKVVDGARGFLENGTEPTLKYTNIKNTSDIIFNAISVIGTILVVIIGAIIGVQFMLGTADEKAKVKETLIPFLIGTIIIFGAYGIWRAFAVAFMKLM